MDVIETMERSIYEVLPQIPFLVDQVGEALKWTKETLGDDGYYTALGVATKVAVYASKVSENNFFKTHLILAALLKNIPNVLEDERFKKFDTASKSVETSIKKLLLEEKVIKERGYYKALSMHLVPLANNDQDSFSVILCEILEDLEQIKRGMDKVGAVSPITEKDYVSVLGCTFVVSNIYMSNLSLFNETQVILNSVNLILNSFNY